MLSRKVPCNCERLVLLIIVNVFLVLQLTQFFQNKNIDNIEINEPKVNQLETFSNFLKSKIQPKVNELETFSNFSKSKIHQCVDVDLSLKHLDIKPVICVKNPESDAWISGSILKGVAWEKIIVKNAIKALRKVPGAFLVDLGANIGMFSLAAAVVGREVVAVDAVYDNLAFIRESHTRMMERSINSVDTDVETKKKTSKNNIKKRKKQTKIGNIRTVYNAISSHPERLYPYTEESNNEGGTKLLTLAQINNGTTKGFDASRLSAPPVDSVTTMDILAFVRDIGGTEAIIKIDIEGFECEALPEEVLDGSSGVKIPYIFMEWTQIMSNLGGRCPARGTLLEKRLYHHNYKPHNPSSMKEMDIDIKKWNHVIWIKTE